uniref:Serine/threonine-protein kinase RIO1 n=1 Tax=Compsopogon caeruleus TaxID=31354 RepID=A0A7S1TFZ6_9RHOD|mmetsp:Transcript_4474/g.8899  ORF Transcript_4474/g.8899 Transcript_4474/m.8899 type:complete len:461 (+) Transcript_4474:1410-2792(+)
MEEDEKEWGEELEVMEWERRRGGLAWEEGIGGSSSRDKDRADRATVEQVLDPATRMILFKMLSRGILLRVDGCVSTGKEANVYTGIAAAERPVAVKVFKTSILVFKDRERYVDGDFRFRKGYHKSNARKMVAVWAEKEFRNLARLRSVGVACPEPILLRSPVLVMSFVGRLGWPAPRLKDVSGLSITRLKHLYQEVVCAMRKMFRLANMVHGDLSEYNMLYWDGKVIIIDVSQSVELDHPQALAFLQRDCLNVNDFFIRRQVPVFPIMDMMDLITSGDPLPDDDDTIVSDLAAAYGDLRVEPLTAQYSQVPVVELENMRLVDYLTDREAARPSLPHSDASMVQAAGMASCFVKASSIEFSSEENASASDGDVMPRDDVDESNSDIYSDSDSDSDSDLDNPREGGSAVNAGGNADPLSKRERKEWKKKIKEANRERRRHKVPKKDKKRKEALARRRRHGKR